MPSDRLETAGGSVGYLPLTSALEPAAIARLPYVSRIFLENILRGPGVDPAHIAAIATGDTTAEIPFRPSRVILQDFTGVPVVADLAAMRDAVARLGGDVARVNPQVPVDLVIDHSVQVDFFGKDDSFSRNTAIEVERNAERYRFLKWAQGAFDGFRVVPPGSGIVHQVNLERLATVIAVRDGIAFPDTLVGTDSHTTMIGGVGVIGFGVGGIEAEAAMLGEPISMTVPDVVGVRLSGALPEGATATDLVLALTTLLRTHGVVGRFVEFVGPGLAALAVPDRATVANMSPEYGATEGYFPIDEQTLAYLRATGRPAEVIDLVERYAKAQMLFCAEGAQEPSYADVLDFDLTTVEPSLAGPRRPQDRVGLSSVRSSFLDALPAFRGGDTEGGVALLRRTKVEVDGRASEVADGSVAIAAITSCTNTSNPSVMIAAGLLARNAVARGLSVPAHVKTSLAPGSPVVMDYLERADVVEGLEALGFYLVGFGCTTCIGNSGPLPEPVAEAVDREALTVAAVLSGNRNFEGRIHPQVKASYLASPPLVVAYALAGTVDIDLTAEPIGHDASGAPVMLSDIWPSSSDIAAAVTASSDAAAFGERYAGIFDGDASWQALSAPTGERYTWDSGSTYIAPPPFLDASEMAPAPMQPIEGARVLVMVGDSVTTDHISPAGSIARSAPAATWLTDHGVEPKEFNSYGSRRGNHEVMMRGTFANIRLRNLLRPGSEGGVTVVLPEGTDATIFDASRAYRERDVPLIILAGAEYGSGSSRDWAAKGVALLGVRAVIATSYERIHRSNLVQMGIWPLEYLPGDSAASLGLTGTESFTLEGVTDPSVRQTVTVVATTDDGRAIHFDTRARLDTPTDVAYLQHGGILPMVLRRLAGA